MRMPITIDVSPADVDLIRTQAIDQNVSVEEFSREAILKAARNAAYLKRIRQAKKNLDEGKGKFFTDEELEALFHGNAV